jgi:hypothetical protein
MKGVAPPPERDRQNRKQCDEQETQRRFERLVKSALNTRPKPLKSMGPKGMPSQSKKQRKPKAAKKS